MARIDNLNNFLIDVGTAIREKNPAAPNPIPGASMDTMIREIQTGGATPEAIVLFPPARPVFQNTLLASRRFNAYPSTMTNNQVSYTTHPDSGLPLLYNIANGSLSVRTINATSDTVDIYYTYSTYSNATSIYEGTTTGTITYNTDNNSATINWSPPVNSYGWVSGNLGAVFVPRTYLPVTNTPIQVSNLGTATTALSYTGQYRLPVDAEVKPSRGTTEFIVEYKTVGNISWITPDKGICWITRGFATTLTGTTLGLGGYKDTTNTGMTSRAIQTV